MRALRRVREEELTTYRDLLRAAYRADLDLGVRFGASDASEEDVLRHLRGNLALALVETTRGTGPEEAPILSTVSIRFPWGPNPGPLDLPHLGWIATDPRLAGRGLGREALEKVEREVLRDGLHAPAVTLGTAQEHPWLGDLYRGAGYRPIGSRDLGLGHITDYYLKTLDQEAFADWRSTHRTHPEGVCP